MLKRRLIPVLFLKHGWLVRSEDFRVHQILGNPVAQVQRYNSWDVDELIYIDITPDGHYDLKRDDLGGDGARNPSSPEEIISMVAAKCFMPLAFGGRIRCLEDIRTRLKRGADKVTVNTQALRDPGFITAAAREFGSQAVVVAVDFRRRGGFLEVCSDLGRTPTGRSLGEWVREAEERGAGEIFLNSIDRDGKASGYDAEAVEAAVAATTVPVIACGGAGRFEDFVGIFRDTGVSAAAAGNLFHFTEMSYVMAKRRLRAAGLEVR